MNKTFCLQLEDIKSGLCLNPDFVGRLAQLSNIRIFVETGTFKGDTAFNISQVVSQVHTIELSEIYYLNVIKRFANSPAVKVYQGDSANVLPYLLGGIGEPIICWLDGHFSGEDTAKGDTNTPIFSELNAIKSHGHPRSILLIDDIRLFQPVSSDHKEDSSLDGYPTMGELLSAIAKLDLGLRLYVIGDIAVCLPQGLNLSISDGVRACTISRIFDEHSSVPVSEVIAAEAIIAKTFGEERLFLESLPSRFAQSEINGLGGHYRLWRGLVRAEQGEHQSALEDFQQAVALGIDHWRVCWYLAQSARAAGLSEAALKALSIVREAAPDFEPAKEFAVQ